MRTFVLLAGFFLAASATPLEKFSVDFSEDQPHQEEEVPEVGQPSFSGASSLADTEPSPANETGDYTSETHHPIDEIQVSSEDSASNDTGDGPSPSVSPGSTPSAKPEEPQQETNNSLAPPLDADPEDCKNASKPNHIYLQCSYSCEGDEMFMAFEKSRCYLNPPNVTGRYPISILYNATVHHAKDIGVCMDGTCVQGTNEAPEDSTVSSTSKNTTAETSETTETMKDDQGSAPTEKPGDASVPSPEHSATDYTPTENNSKPENPVRNVGQDENKEASSPLPNGPVALPEGLPAMS